MPVYNNKNGKKIQTNDREKKKAEKGNIIEAWQSRCTNEKRVNTWGNKFNKSTKKITIIILHINSAFFSFVCAILNMECKSFHHMKHKIGWLQSEEFCVLGACAGFCIKSDKAWEVEWQKCWKWKKKNNHYWKERKTRKNTHISKYCQWQNCSSNDSLFFEHMNFKVRSKMFFFAKKEKKMGKISWYCEHDMRQLFWIRCAS